MASNVTNIRGLDKVELLRWLYNESAGWGHPRMTEQRARTIIENSQGEELCYVDGVLLGINLSGDQLDPSVYDLEHGSGKAERTIEAFRRSQKFMNGLLLPFWEGK